MHVLVSCIINLFLCPIFLYNVELRTSELLLSKLLALQEQLAGWLMDYYIVKLGVECSIILV